MGVLHTMICVFVARNYEILRENIKLVEVLGEGQFGDVYKGMFTNMVNSSLLLIIPTSARLHVVSLMLFQSIVGII